MGLNWWDRLFFLVKSLPSNLARLTTVLVFVSAVPITFLIFSLDPNLQPSKVRDAKLIEPAKPDITGTATAVSRLYEDDEAGRMHICLLELDVALRRGDTLLKLLSRHDLKAGAAHDLIRALRPHFDPKDLRAGQSIQLLVDADENRVRGLEYVVGSMAIRADRTTEGWLAERIAIPFVDIPRVARGQVEGSLYESGVESGLSAVQIMELATLFEYDIDFFSDFRRGDDFSVLFEETRYADGRHEMGRILAAELSAGGESFQIFRYNNENGKSGYYDNAGKALRRAFLRAPLSFKKISSRFSLNRRHPIFRTVRPHRAIDYAAPSGTPVVALGNGQVTFAGWRGGYGKMVEIRHPNGYTTRYAHFSKIASKIRRGGRVSQGQVVGYVGQTGHATGPHLHFEMLRKGEKINFLALKLPPVTELNGADREEFFKQRDEQLVLLKDRSILVAHAPQ